MKMTSSGIFLSDENNGCIYYKKRFYLAKKMVHKPTRAPTGCRIRGSEASHMYFYLSPNVGSPAEARLCRELSGKAWGCEWWHGEALHMDVVSAAMSLRFPPTIGWSISSTFSPMRWLKYTLTRVYNARVALIRHYTASCGFLTDVPKHYITTCTGPARSPTHRFLFRAGMRGWLPNSVCTVSVPWPLGLKISVSCTFHHSGLIC